MSVFTESPLKDMATHHFVSVISHMVDFLPDGTATVRTAEAQGGSPGTPFNLAVMGEAEPNFLIAVVEKPDQSEASVAITYPGQGHDPAALGPVGIQALRNEDNTILKTLSGESTAVSAALTMPGGIRRAVVVTITHTKPA